MLEVWGEIGNDELPLKADGLQLAGKFRGTAAADEARKQDGSFRGRLDEGSGRADPVHRLPAPFSVSAG
jgi:hypothetical protein